MAPFDPCEAYTTLQGTGELLHGSVSIRACYYIHLQHQIEERDPLPPVVRSQALGVIDCDFSALVSIPESQNPRLRLEDGRVVKIRFISGNHFALVGCGLQRLPAQSLRRHLKS